MRNIIILILLLIGSDSFGQSRTYIGTANELNTRLGGYQAQRWFRPPMYFYNWSSQDSAGMMWFDSAGTRTLWYHNGVNRVQLASGSSGTVTSLTAGFGLTGGTITTSGTINVNPSVIATKSALDSVAGLIPTDVVDSATLADSMALKLSIRDSATRYVTPKRLADSTAAVRAAMPSVTGLVPYSGATTNVNLGEYYIRGGAFVFDTTPTVTPIDGTMYWDNVNKTPQVQLNGEVTLQVGQELHVRARNNTGVTITNGSVVYINGAQGNNPTIALADADSASTSEVVGVTTEAIIPNETGYVTAIGVVNGINTSGWNSGDRLYLSTTNGQLTNVPPSPPHISKLVATALNSTNNGRIFVMASNSLATDTTLTNGANIAPTTNAVKRYVISQGFLDGGDTASLSNRINLKLNSSDTVSLSNRINTKLNSTDTASLSNRINARIPYTDTTNNVLTRNNTITIRNKRFVYTSRTVANYTTSVTIPADTLDAVTITAQAGALLFNAPSGTPTNFQQLVICIRDNGTPRALTFNAAFKGGDLTLPTTTVANRFMYIYFLYNENDARWYLTGKPGGYAP